MLILRMLAGWALIAAVMALVNDATHWASGSARMLSLSDHATLLAPDWLAAAERIVTQQLHPWIWSPLLRTLLATPSAIACAALSACLYAAARPRRTVDIYAN